MARRSIGIDLVLLLSFLISGQTLPGARVHAATGSADLCLTYGLVCDPGCGYLASTNLENLGPDVATGVVVRFQIPEDAPLQSLSVNYPHRATSPGVERSGAVTIEIESLAPEILVSIDVRFYNPPQEGWQAPVMFEATASEVDPDPTNNTISQSLSNPLRPVVDQVRELHDPFRLELVGRNLDIGTFGAVVIGECEQYRPGTESDPTGMRLVLLGGKELRRRLPVGKPVPIVIQNEMGGNYSFSYRRERR